MVLFAFYFFWENNGYGTEERALTDIIYSGSSKLARRTKRQKEKNPKEKNERKVQKGGS